MALSFYAAGRGRAAGDSSTQIIPAFVTGRDVTASRGGQTAEYNALRKYSLRLPTTLRLLSTGYEMYGTIEFRRTTQTRWRSLLE